MVPAEFRTVEGIKLGRWVGVQRGKYKKGKLSGEQVKKLEEIGFVWSILVEWEENFLLLLDYKNEKGNCLVTQTYKTVEGAKLGNWVGVQRREKKKGRLSGERVKKLEEIGFVFNVFKQYDN